MRIFIILFLISSFVIAQEEKKDSPLVEAAKKSGKYKFQKGTKITNDKLKSTSQSPTEIKEKAEGTEKEGEVLDTELKDSKGRKKEDWQKMIQEAKENVIQLEGRIKELESRLNKLTNDYYSWDDAAYREGVIKPNMDKVAQQLEAAREQLKAAKERIPELEEEARKSGALPGWLR